MNTWRRIDNASRREHMLTPVVCKCGLPVADVATVYREIRQQRAKEALKKNNCTPPQAMISPNLNIDMSDVLKDLRVDRDCCRTTLTTAMDFRDHH